MNLGPSSAAANSVVAEALQRAQVSNRNRIHMDLQSVNETLGGPCALIFPFEIFSLEIQRLLRNVEMQMLSSGM